MNLSSGFLSLAVAGFAFAASNAPVATVTSRAPFSVQGIEVPVEGATVWPVMAGDVIQTRSAAAEVQMKDGTRIFIAPSSRYVVGNADLAATRAGNGSPGSVGAAALHGPVLTILNKGAVAFNHSAGRSGGSSGPTPKDAGTSTSLAQELALYGGPASPLVEAIDEALQTQFGTTVKVTGNTYYITGITATIGAGASQPVTFIVTPTSISIVAGTVGPSTPASQIPPPLASFNAPPPGAPPAGCSGITSPPKDVTPVVIKIPGVC